ncbi:MAG: hypothetical protein J6E46_06685 [Faecalicoccus sp.]|nr:hypothetical protein [Faecalicoccus sp.]
MPLKINVMNCPSCGAAIPIQEGTTQITCSYCGSKFAITNENEFVYRHVDEARVKQAEIERMKWLYELEQKEKNRKSARFKLFTLVLIALCLFLIGIIGTRFNNLSMVIVGMFGAFITAIILFDNLIDNARDNEHEQKLKKEPESRTIDTLKDGDNGTNNHFCGYCGSKLTPNSSFCHKCGKKVSENRIINDENNLDWDYRKQKSLTEKKLVNIFHNENNKLNLTSLQGDIKDQGDQLKKDIQDFLPTAKIIAIGMGVLFITLIVVPRLLFSGNEGGENPHTDSEEVSSQKVENDRDELETDYSIEKGSEYSYMHDESTLYVATAMTDTLIKLERWEYADGAWKPNVGVGAYDINDSSSRFSWLDENHTAFTLILDDRDKMSTWVISDAVFTVDINEEAACKGTNYCLDIISYAYKSDDRHLYRAIPLTEDMIKIECWKPSLNKLDSSFVYAYDLASIYPNKDDDFKWINEEHTSFSTSLEDLRNLLNLSSDKSYLFEIENPNAQYKTTAQYLNEKI